MPKRAAPGNRDRIEAALTPQLAAALNEMRELLDVVNWTRTPLCAPFQQAATLLLAAKLVEAGECCESDAIDRAAIALGLSEHTARSRARRWSETSRDHMQYAQGAANELGANWSGDTSSYPVLRGNP